MCIRDSFNGLLLKAGVTDPIQSSDGVESDHKVVHASFQMPRVPDYSMHEYSYYRESEGGRIAFGDWIRGKD